MDNWKQGIIKYLESIHEGSNITKAINLTEQHFINQRRKTAMDYKRKQRTNPEFRAKELARERIYNKTRRGGGG